MNRTITATFAIALFLLTSLHFAIVPIAKADTVWSSDQRLTVNQAIDMSPAVSGLADGRVLVVWQSYRAGKPQLYSKVFAGTWSPDALVPLGDSENGQPSLSRGQDGSLWLAWRTNRTGNFDIFARRSADNGQSWGSESQITASLAADHDPAIAALNNGKLMVTFRSDRVGNDEVYYRLFNATWQGPEVNLSVNPSADRTPSLTQMADGKIWAAWTSNRDGDGEIYVTKGTLSGDSVVWGPVQRLTFDLSDDRDPGITQDDDRSVWVAWQTDRDSPADASPEIYYKQSFDNGASWSPDTRLTTDTVAIDAGVGIARDLAGVIWVVWHSTRLNNFEIYYKTSPVPTVHDVAASDTAAQRLFVYQGFNLTLGVGAQNLGNVGENVNVLVHANSSTVGQVATTLAAGEFKPVLIVWNTAGYRVGNYVLQGEVSGVPQDLNPSNNLNTGPTVQVRLVGDTNGDRVVDLDDVLTVAVAWGSTPGTPGWVPQADINGNGIVDLDDVLMTAVNWGQTA